MRLSIIITFVLFNVCCLTAIAQNSMVFQPLTGRESVGQSITYGVVQEKSGSLWIATDEGVLKHNSIDFKIYNTNGGFGNGLGNQVFEIFLDSTNELWIGTSEGFGKYDATRDVFKAVPTDGALVPTSITSIQESPSHEIFISAFNGLWRLDADKKSLTQVINSTAIIDMAFHNGELYLATRTHIYTYNTATGKPVELAYQPATEFSFLTSLNGNLYAGSSNGILYQCSNGTTEQIFKGAGTIKTLIEFEDSYYMGSDGAGIYKLTGDFTLQRHYYSDEDDPDSINNDGVYAIVQGTEDHLWIATYGGGVLSFEQASPFTVFQHRRNDVNSLKSDYVRAIAQDQKGNVWFGTKKGLSIYDSNTKTWTHITSLVSGSTNSIVTAIAAKDDHAYVATYNHGLFKIKKTSKSITNLTPIFANSEAAQIIYDMEIMPNGDLWTTGLRGKTAKIRDDRIIATLDIPYGRAIRRTKNNEFLIVRRQDVFKVNTDNNDFEKLSQPVPAETLKFSNLQDAVEFSGALFYASNGAGIIKVAADGSVTTINSADGLPSNTVLALISTDPTELWASTTRGLARLVFKDDVLELLTYANIDGLESNEFVFNSATVLKNGSMVFGSTSGAVQFDPSFIPVAAKVPFIELDELRIDNELIAVGDEPLGARLAVMEKLQLKHNENSIGISFVGITFDQQEDVTYSYKLENFDEDWSAPDGRNFATYTNLGSGNYTFKVKAINKYGIASAVEELKIRIHRPWWWSNLAIVIYTILLGLLIYILAHFTRVLIKKKNADEQIAFFNNITHEIKTPLAVLMSSLEKVTEENSDQDQSKTRIKKTVQRINSLFEQLLNFHKVTSQNSIEQHLKEFEIKEHIGELIDDFRPMLQEREISIELQSNLRTNHFYHDRDVMDKVLRNILSNAIKYSNAGDHIDVHLSNEKSNDLKVLIADQGIGIPKEQQKFILKNYYRANNAINSQRPGTGLGLVMVKKLIEKTDGSISFTSKENEGTTFTIVLKNFKDAFLEKETQRVIVNPAQIEQDEQLQDQLNALSDSKILVVEDNDDLRQLMVENLARYFQVFDAADGQQGLEVASQQFPDLILTDLIMPHMDGMEMSRKLKEDINLNHIPVFMLTVLQSSNQKLNSLQSGITEYLEKPVNYKLLLAKIINTLNYQKQLRKRYTLEKDSNNAAIFKNEKDQEFLELLEKNIIDHLENDEFTVHDLSAMMGMSRTSLYMKLKNLVDLSPQDFIINTKLKLAKKLLIETDLSIKEVAFRCGFTNPKYFSTSFKKFYDLTPSGFLESLK